jgi:hypothetical protein
MEIRSYRRVFQLERRIYRIDRLRLNPGGVPVHGIVYFAGIFAVMLLAGAVPLLGILIGALPWYLRDLVLPGVGAMVLSVIRVEGRPFHLAAQSVLRLGLGPRRLAGIGRRAAVDRPWRPSDVLMLPDGSDGSLRRMRYTGPGAVLVAVEHERSGRAIEQGTRGLAKSGLRPALVVTASPAARVLAQAKVISLGAGTRLLVRSSAGRRER